MSFLIHRRTASYGISSIKSSQRQHDAIRHSDIPPPLNCPKTSNDISTGEPLAQNVPPEALPGNVGRSRLQVSGQSCWQRLFYFHYETNLPGRSRFRQVRLTLL